MHDRTYTWLKLAALAGVVALLLLTGVLLRVSRRTASGRRWAERAAVVSGVATGLWFIPALVFAVCSGPAPGESDGAWALRRAAEPVIAALRSYAAEHGGRYPAALDSLVPRYLSASSAHLRPVQPESPVEYHVDSAGYVLWFGYGGPGWNSCEYRPRVGRWECGGLW